MNFPLDRSNNVAREKSDDVIKFPDIGVTEKGAELFDL